MREFAFVHDADAKIRVFGEMDDERVKIARVGQRPSHHQRASHRARAVAERDRAGLLEQAQLGDLPALAASGQRRHRRNAHAAGVARAAQNEIDDGGIVDGRQRRRGRDERRHAARRGGESCAGDGFAMLGARLADEGLHVDEARRDDVAGAVDEARAVWSVGRSNGLAEFRDDAV